MTINTEEQLSALLDDEFVSENSALLDRVASSEPLRNTWDRYHLIGDVLRGEGLRTTAAGVSAQVREQIEREPAIVSAPRAASQMKQPDRWMRPAMGAAVAASVATVAVLTFTEITDSGDVGTGARPLQVAVAPVPVSPSPQMGTRWKNLDESKVESKLNRLLVKHNEYAASAGMGLMPYSTFVSYDGSGVGK